jgi:class 3 adenylate cyclase
MIVDRDPIRFMRSGSISIAYQTVGSGRELFYVPGWEASLDWFWVLPAYARFLERLAAFSRLVIYDQRGKGESERLPVKAPATLDDHVADLLAVAESVNAGWQSTLFAANEGGFIAMRAAARHPHQFGRLVLFAASPVFVQVDDLPWESTLEREMSNVRSFERSTSWDEWTRSYVRDVLPSIADDERAIAWLASAARLTAPPGYSIAAIREMLTWDVRADLGSISVPTLIIHPSGVTAWRIESARYMAERIPDARLVELPLRDAYPWAGDSAAILDEIQGFVTGSRERTRAERRLASVLFTDLADSTARAVELGDAAWSELLERHHQLVRTIIRRHHGSEVDTAGDGFFASFDTPGRAVAAAQEIVASVAELGVDARVGCHVGEVETIDDKAGGLAVVVGARIAALARPGEVLVSSTVRDLVAGSGLAFEDAGEHELKGVPDRWRLYRVVG